jgi:F-type H+-transporting ATPase subunit b
MDLVKPALGLVFWMTVSFIIILALLKKFAWGPILKGIKSREESIDGALKEAQKARKEMESLKSSNEQLLKEARNERDKILKEARETKDSIVNEAKGKAKEEADKIISSAREAIQNEKLAAITELKNQVANLSIEIAEKILKEELSSEDKQKTLVKGFLQDVSLN